MLTFIKNYFVTIQATFSKDSLSWLLYFSTAMTILMLRVLNPEIISLPTTTILFAYFVILLFVGYKAPRQFNLFARVSSFGNCIGVLMFFFYLLFVWDTNSYNNHHIHFVILTAFIPLMFLTIFSSFRNIRTIVIFSTVFYILLLSISGYFLQGHGASYPDSFIRSTVSAFLCALTIFLIICGGTITYIKNEHKEKLDVLKDFSFKDKLTNLPNRTAFYQRLDEICLDKNVIPYTLISVDINDFKSINGHYGVEIGDYCLKTLAKRLENTVTQDFNIKSVSSLIARTAGDEFSLLLPNTSSSEIARYCELLETVLNQSIVVDDLKLTVPVMISACRYPIDAKEAHILFKQLEWAMRKAKKQQKYCIYSPELGTQMSEADKLKVELGKAVERNELEVYYQPLVNLVTGKVQSVEALLRWDNPKLGRVSPEVFIPLAEQSGHILPIGNWVLEACCQQLRLWLDAKYDISIAVNISVAQFKSANFLEDLQTFIQVYKIETSRLELEITESLPFDSMTLKRLHELRELGFNVKLDDFGTGYSSLSVVSLLPISMIKIDKSFVQYIEENSNNKQWVMVKTIINLAQNFDLTVVAEGVETKNQFVKLKQLGCDFVQGYFISKPMPAQELEQTFLQNANWVVEPDIYNTDGYSNELELNLYQTS